ncbi:nucleoside deaminase [Agromyces kandeliae]|uniref:Nucleoside deaminase n=1 Tax=Agromyces kandeliae TaxID=2666141 RepID=A0A6L5R3J3_9MICO|nr:nucleoside deaminase [Agromyces kandeliae]MRX44550.1 nucleoside deaminase [Agromyces kandeliae]
MGDHGISDGDLARLRRCVELAQQARERGDHPFGSIVVTADGRVVEGMNTVVTRRDPTGHAETNVVREAAAVLDERDLATATLYTSTEPCAMCSGAIYWSGIPRVVFALSEAGLRDIVAEQEGVPTLSLPSREVFARGGRPVAVVGPADLPEAAAVHDGFWA